MIKHLKILVLLTLIVLMAQPLFANAVADKTVEWLMERGLSPQWIVLIISMLPIIELRGSIPVAILLFNMSWQEAVTLSLIGNLIPVPFILLFMDGFFIMLSKNKHGAKFTEWLFARTRRKGKSIEKYEALGLALFVGIPLPGTGAWTGSFAANIFGIKFWRSLLFIFIGVLLAAAIVISLSLMGNMAVQ
ncbi:MAG: small multi-drug export protein [Candidatus Cloacimonetes bacterium]|nr:small multi-drug export protein [Candidatus Cloacimonadota bacterium]